MDEERRTLERCEEEIIARQAPVEHLERVKADDQGDRNLWRKKLPALLTWKQKTKRHVGKRFGSKLARDSNKKRKIEEPLMFSFPVRRVRFVSVSKDNDPDEEEKVTGSGQTLYLS